MALGCLKDWGQARESDPALWVGGARTSRGRKGGPWGRTPRKGRQRWAAESCSLSGRGSGPSGWGLGALWKGALGSVGDLRADPSGAAVGSSGLCFPDPTGSW